MAKQSKRKVTATDIEETIPERKLQSDYNNQLWGYLLRKPSYWVAARFVNFGLSANTVTAISSIFLLLGIVSFITLQSYAHLVVAAVLVNGWYFLDFVDGNVARYDETSSGFGEYFDWLVGIAYYSLTPIAVGVGIATTPELARFASTNGVAILIGLATSLTVLGRKLTSQKYYRIIESKKDGKHRSGTARFVIASFLSFETVLLLAFSLIQAPDVWLVLFFFVNLVLLPGILLSRLYSLAR